MTAPPDGPAPGYRRLSVVVPVFDERATVVEIVDRMRRVSLPLEREIVLVDDGSTDGTRELLPALEDETVRVILHPSNRGKGAAIRTALAHVTGDLVLIQDADLEYDPADWPVLLAPVLAGRSRVVYGSRLTVRRPAMSRASRLGNRFLVVLTNLLYRSSLSDMETGAKVFDRRLLAGLGLAASRFDFEPEVTAKLLRRGERIEEVAISYRARSAGEGKKIGWRDGVAAVVVLLRLRLTRAGGAG